MYISSCKTLKSKKKFYVNECWKGSYCHIIMSNKFKEQREFEAYKKKFFLNLVRMSEKPTEMGRIKE